MKVALGYAFTEIPIEGLRRKGFRLDWIEPSPHPSFRSAICFLRFLNGESTAFEIREILDEREYIRWSGEEKFEPKWIESSETQLKIENPNTTDILVRSWSQGQELSNEADLFFRIRKKFTLYALELNCRSFDVFAKLADPDAIWNWQGRRCGLIHLGPNCFDLLVTELIP
ncbi:MAG: hypothetical protein ACXWC9_00665 [Pseudobdellovibrionaceae bacterium]